MLIELAAPASLPLGLVRLGGRQGVQTCLLGITLQHPPIHVYARPASQLAVTGARADLGSDQARQILERAGAGAHAEIEIELAIPQYMGLGSEAMLGLSIAKVLARLNGLNADDTAALAGILNLGRRHALELWGFDRGGLVMAGMEASANTLPPLVRRAEVAHPENAAWAFVMFLGRSSASLPDTLEADLLSSLLNAAPHVSTETGRLADNELWPAVEGNDVVLFGRALMEIQRLNLEALASAGTPAHFTPEEQVVLALMRDNGAVAWGRSFAGLGLFGLIRGAQPSRDLRKTIAEHVGFFGGTVMATVTDVRGVSMQVNTKTSITPPPTFGA